MKSAASLLLIALMSSAASDAAAEAVKPLPPAEVLPPISVKGEVQCSFGFGVRLHRDPGTRKVLRLFVTKVRKGSSAAKLEVKPGDEILSINGEKVRGMDGEAKQGARLFSLLCNRSPGETVEMEIMDPDRVRRLTLRADKR